MVASEVATDMIMTSSAGNPCAANNIAKTGTIIRPPPIPKSPAVNPATVPNKILAKKIAITLFPWLSVDRLYWHYAFF